VSDIIFWLLFIIGGIALIGPWAVLSYLHWQRMDKDPVYRRVVIDAIRTGKVKI